MNTAKNLKIISGLQGFSAKGKKLLAEVIDYLKGPQFSGSFHVVSETEAGVVLAFFETQLFFRVEVLASFDRAFVAVYLLRPHDLRESLKESIMAASFDELGNVFVEPEGSFPTTIEEAPPAFLGALLKALMEKKIALGPSPDAA